MGKKVIDQLMGSKVKVKLLRFLLTSEKGYTLRELASEVGVDHKSIGTAVQDFKEIGLVSVEQYGRSYAVLLLRDSPLLPVIEALFALEVSP